MPSPMPVDPEVLAYMARSDAFYPPDAVDFPLAEQRAWYDKYALSLRAPLPPSVAFADGAVDAPGRAIPIRRYTPQGMDGRAPLILYSHGGGYILGGLESHHDVCAELCALTGLELVSVDYRLAPEHVHPAQVDDVDAAFLALSGEGREIIAGGDSAGAVLHAGQHGHALFRESVGPGPATAPSV